MTNPYDARQDEQVLCVFHDTTSELRQVVGVEDRPLAHRTVSVPRLSTNENALWLSCDEGRDRWYVYRGTLIAGFVSSRLLLNLPA